MFRPTDLFDLSQTEHAALFAGCTQAWEALARIKAYLRDRLNPGLCGPAREVGGSFLGELVFVGEGTVIEPGVMIKGPAFIGRRSQIRHGAYLREDVIVGDDCVVGNSCELKNSWMFNQCQVPHFNYVGDSILGHKAHLGAGVILSNVKVIKGNVQIQHEGGRIDSGLRKFGALLGDQTDIGCNAVLNPGSIIGRGSLIYPCTNWRGVLPPGSIAKNKAHLEVVSRRSK